MASPYDELIHDAGPENAVIPIFAVAESSFTPGILSSQKTKGIPSTNSNSEEEVQGDRGV